MSCNVHLIIISLLILKLCKNVYTSNICLDLNKKDGMYLLSFTIGRHFTQYDIDLQSDIVIIDYSNYKANSPNTGEVIEDNSRKVFSYKNYILKDTFIIPNTINTKLIFQSVSNSIFSPEKSFGLSVYGRKKEYSFLYQLKENNIIDHLSFTLMPKESNKHSICLGNYDGNFTKYKFKGEFNVIEHKQNVSSNIHWYLNMTHVSFNNTLYKNTMKTYFQSNLKYIIAPESFFDYWYQTDLFSLQCKLAQHYHYSIVCDCEAISHLPTFKFVFEKYTIGIDSSFLYEKKNNECEFNIIKMNGGSKWVIGTDILDKMVLNLNFETNSLKLYSNVISIEKNDIAITPNNDLKHFLIYLCLTLIFGIVIDQITICYLLC